MTTWNHRVCKRKVDNSLGEKEDWYDVRECFYENKKDKTPHSWTSCEIAPSGSTLEELRTELERMLKSLDKPVVEIDE